MFVLGLTGGIGSGKSTVASVFSELGIDVVNADQLARDVVEPESEALAAIEERFGTEILQEDKSLNRSKLREIVFAAPSDREWLEQLTHPLIAQLLVRALQTASSPYVILESPLLLETTQKDLVDRVLVVDVDEETQFKRTLSRDGSSEETIKGIIDTQLPRAKRLEEADDVVDNSLELADVRKQLLQLHDQYLELAKSQ
ncbi:MAG: dephospho-CoA kinase [Pseudomonadales bacterium]|nr:dephospho-CoA kinase [Pseudomonadales bacterium]